MKQMCPVCNRSFKGDYCIYCKLEDNKEKLFKKTHSSSNAVSNSESFIDTSEIICSIEIYDEAKLLDDGRFRIGSIWVVNNSDIPHNLSYSVFSDEKEIIIQSFNLNTKEEKTEKIESNISLFSSEVDSKHTIVVKICDSRKHSLCVDSKCVIFRPYLDFNLNNLNTSVARWVTPNSKDIRDLLLPDGPIAKVMSRDFGEFSITGYQGDSPKSIVRKVLVQMSSVYAALSNMNFSYVSDTFTYGKDSFQRVKTPRKVLGDKSGNCIEFSCLFASIFEAMGLHPVLIFPPGHALCGVQITSNCCNDAIDADLKESIFVKMTVPSKGGEVEKTDILFFETTSISNHNVSFDDSVKLGTKIIIDNMDWIIKNHMVCLINQKRNDGIFPMIE